MDLAEQEVELGEMQVSRVETANNPLQATRWSGRHVFNHHARRAPERERWTVRDR